MKPHIEVEADGEAVAQAAKRRVVELCEVAVQERGRFTLALSGGSTPRRLYELLATESLPFKKMFFFFGDERHVPPDDEQSNFRMAKEAFFSRTPVPAQNIHRIRGELLNAGDAAQRYEETLRKFFALPDGEFPRLDCVLLGLGADGHTASLFPGTEGLLETKKWVIGQRVEKLQTERISLTPPMLNAARAVIFLVQGADKAEPVHAALEVQGPAEELPARVVQPAPGGLWWILDRAAASKLSAQ